MDNVSHSTVVRQLFSLMPLEVEHRLLLADRYAKKLTISKAIKVFLVAQLNNWASYSEMENRIRAEPKLQSLFGLTSISGSQLSRRLPDIPTEMLHELFLNTLAQVQRHTKGYTGVTGKIGRLALIDSSTLRLPLGLGDWARMSAEQSGVKLHVRLIAESPDVTIPDAVIPTTLNVGDRAPAIDLVAESDVTHVMDRGYDNYKQMDDWVRRGIRFVMRMRDRTLTTVLEEQPLPAGSFILRDAKVSVGGDFRRMEQPVRLVEFQDEQGRPYRLITSRWDISAEEVAHIYKCRWLIELFFKWIKQHLRLKKLYSYHPQAIWNQIYLALIAYLLVQLVKFQTEAKQSPWRVLELLRIYLLQDWSVLINEMNRQPTKPSKGRQRGHPSKRKTLRTEIGILRETKVKD